MTFWTDARTEQAKKLFYDGLSAEQAACAMGAQSRCAILGKWHRLGLNRGKPLNTERKARKAAGAKPYLGKEKRKVQRLENCAALRNMLADEAPPNLTPEQRSRTVPLMRLTASTCRWPYGDPAKPDFCFCGCEPVPDKPYCAEHAAVACGRAA